MTTCAHKANPSRNLPVNVKTFPARRAVAQLLAFLLILQTTAPPAIASVNAPALVSSLLTNVSARFARAGERRAEPRAAAAAVTTIATTASQAGFGVVLTALETPFAGHVGVDDHGTTRKLAVSSNSPTGQPNNFELVGADGAHVALSNLGGLAGKLRIATARDDTGQGTSLGGFRPGELFTGTGAAGAVARVTPDGAAVQNPWVVLPGENGAEEGTLGGLHLDRTGVFGGHLIVVTTAGGVWRVSSTGQATRVAALNTPLSGVTTLPDDATKYGPWAGKILAGAKEQSVVYAVGADGGATAYQLGFQPGDIELVPAHENFYAVDSGAQKLLGAPDGAFVNMIGDVLVAQGEPGVLARVHWNGAQFEVSQIATAGRFEQIAFSPAGVAPLVGIKPVFDKIAAVRHAPQLNSGRVEGSLWQMLAENLVLDGNDTITADLFVPGTPNVTAGGGHVNFGGVIQGPDSAQPTGYAVSLSGNASLRHLITRANPIELAAVAAPPAPAGTRVVALTKAAESAGDFSTLRDLSLSGKAGEVFVPPGTYGRFNASAHTAFVFGLAGSTEPSVYNLEELTLSGGSELKLLGPVVLNVRGNVTLVGSTVGAADNPKRLALRVSDGAVKLSGGSVLYGLVRIPRGLVSIEGQARLRGTVSCDRLVISGNGVLQITENDLPPPAINRPPAADAGPDQTITLPTDTVSLSGTATDDGLPANNSLTTQWTVVSGPGPVSFGDASNPTTTATFTVPGDYVLELRASDGQLFSADTASVTVIPRNQPPVVDAGPDQTVELPAGATLAGTVSDDALPRGSALTVFWEKVSGPGEVHFTHPNAPATGATFSTAGDYVLRLSANDTEYTVADLMTVTVYPVNQPPAVNAGPDLTVRLPAGVALNGTATDDGWPFGSTLTVQWTQVSGPGTTTFGNAANAVTLASFDAPGTYVLRLSANDTRFTESDEASVLVLPANEPPTADAGPDRAGTIPSIPRDRPFALRALRPAGDAVGVAYHQPTNRLLVSANHPSGFPYNFALVSADGAMNGFAPLSDINDKLKPAVARDDTGQGTSLGGFRAGELFAGNGVPGQILRVSPDGKTVQNPWVTLPGENGVPRGGMHVDRTGVFGGDLVVVTNAGGVWRVNAAGQATRVASLGTQLAGVTTVPDDATKYGPWAGKILAGNETQARLYAIDAQGNFSFQQLGIRPEDIDVIPANENFYGVDYVTNTLWGAAAAGFQSMVGDILVAQESPGVLYRVRWNGTTFEKTQLAEVAQWENGTFAPAGVGDIPTVAAGVPLAGVVNDDGLPAGVPLGVRWTKLSGPGPVGFDNSGAASTSAFFTEPGTYTLRLTADDGEFSDDDEMTVTISAPNIGPVVNAGADKTITLPNNVTLDGTATDDGLPTGSTLSLSWTKVSGPGTVAFINEASAITGASFSAPGIYVLRLSASDGDLTAVDEVTVTVRPENHAPVVDAGPDQTITLPGGVTLNGTVIDDGVPPDVTVTAQWTKVSGPGNVTFANPNSPVTSATFSVDGTYVLRLTASDTEHTAFDEVTIVVNPRPNLPPVVNAGPDKNVILPAGTTLAGTATDDGLPNGVLNVLWTKQSGPGNVTFSAQTSATTNAAFSLAGTYVLRLTASDTVHTVFDEVTVTVFPPNNPPVVNAGPDQIITLPNPASLSGTATDDGQPAGSTLTTQWTKVSGPGSVTFADPAARATTAIFSTDGTYVLRLTASDTLLTASDDLTVVVMPQLIGHLTCTRSNKGTDFWLMFNENLGSPELRLFITGEFATTGTVTIPGLNFTQNFTVTPGQVATVNIPATAQVTTTDGSQNRGIHVVAGREVAVYGLNRIAATTDAFLGLPTTMLGTEYITLGYRNSNIVNGTQFGVVATANDTVVTITPSVTTGTRTVNVPYNITLNQGQAYQLRNTGASPNDLSGTIISSTKPVAVFGSHQCANIPGGVTFCDHIVEQIPPPDTWGRNFVTMPLATRRNGDTFRFLAAQDATTVAVNGAIVTTLNKGKLHERIISGPATITSDKPILVAQYSNGTSFDGVTSDPFMMLIPPFEQFGGNYTLTTPATGFEINYINVVAPTAAVGQIKLDGVNISPSLFTTIGVSGFSGAQVPITKGTHNLNSTAAPFGAFVYGFASFDSYGYPGSVCVTSAVIGTRIDVTPKTKTNLIGTSDCVTARVSDLNDAPVGGARVEFVVSGVNPTTGSAQTDASGNAQFCYTGNNAGADLIVASVTTNISDTATKQWNPPNKAPVVNAGADQTVTLPAPATLNGTVTDDGLPGGLPTVTWSKVSGPGSVAFVNPNSAVTSATFSTDGTYVLRLSANDGDLTASDDVTVVANPVPPNVAPVVNAGPDQTTHIGANLVVNPGNEQQLVNGEIHGWFEASGDAWTQATAHANGFPESFDGTTYFYAGETATAELRQDVNLAAFAAGIAAGTQQFSFRVAVRSREEAAPDTARIVVEYRDAANANVISTLETGEIPATGGWAQLEDTRAAPAGTGWMRIRLFSTRNTGATNDAYFDAVALRPVGTAGVRLAGTATDDGLPYLSTLSANWTKVSGPGAVSFSDANSAATSATFNEPGTYTLRLTATDTEATTSDEVTITVVAPNQAPTVNAGPDQTITLPDGATLSGTVTDDGLPPAEALTVSWTKINGPGAVTFADPGAASTSVTFSAPGTYTLRLAANDTEYTATDDLIVTVKPAAVNQPPTVSAGPDQSVTLPSSAFLAGTATDDGLPTGSTLVSTWSVVSGPSPVTFADAHSATTTATFGGAGTYVLRLSATDGAFTASDEVAVVVGEPPGNRAPTVNAGADKTITLPVDTTTLQATATDDGLPAGSTLTYAWSKVSGPGAVSFSAPNALTTAVSFTTAGRYTLRLTASDSALTGFDEVVVTVIGQNQPPTANAGPDLNITLPAGAALAGSVSDDGLPAGSTLGASWSVVSGPGAVGFSNANSATTTATFAVEGTYVLRLTASDSELTGFDDVTVVVNPRVPPPVVAVSSPADGATITTRTPIVGSVSQGSTWRVEYSLNGSEGSGTTPVWTTIASGTTPVTNGLLATFDPTQLLNGNYAVRLVATDAGGQTSVSNFSAVVEGGQKVGNFSVNFTDMVVPVSGLPIEVVRTYDSRDKRAGDFGVGWTLGLRNIRVEKNGVLGKGWEETRTPGILPNYCAQPTKPHTVSLAFPNGKVYKFQGTINPSCQRVYPIQFASYTFAPLPGTTGSLAVAGPSEVFLAGSYPGPVDVLDLNTFNYFDASVFRLTTEDGTSYVVDQQTGVRSVTDPNGNTLNINANGVTHSDGKSVTFTRDARGRITQITDPQGQVLTYTYDSNGDLVSFRDRENAASTYAYNNAHGLLSITDPRGLQPVRNEYDDAGRLVSQTDSFGKTVNFSRDANTRQEVITDRTGRSTVMEYDDRGNITRVTDAAGHVTARAYDANDNLLSETDALGKTTNYTYDAGGHRLTETDPLGHTTRRTYNARGQELTVTDPAGRVITNTFDAKGNQTSFKDALGQTASAAYNTKGLAVSVTDARGQTTTYQYDAAGNVTRQTNALGHATVYTYDANNNKLSESATRTAGGVSETLTTSYTYDRQNRLLKTTYPDGSFAENVYNAAGQLIEKRDRLARGTTYLYDEMGRLRRTTFPDGKFEEIEYDAEGRTTKEIDRAGRATSHVYDALGRLTKTTFPDGKFVTKTYDAAGQLVAETNELDQTTRFEYDAAGRQTKVTDALNQVTTFGYDDAGNQTSKTDAKNQTTTYEYDFNGRRTRVVFPDGTSSATAYDAAGNAVSKTDQAGRTTQFEHDAAGRLSKVTDALGHATRYAYDEVGNLLTQTDANNHTTRYEYDRAGRRTRRRLPMSMSETFSYDAAGRLTSRTDFRGKRTAFGYDAADRLLTKTPDPSFGEPAVGFTYTATGQRATMTDATGTTHYTYDERDRLLSKAAPQGTLAYTYDAAGRLLTVRSSNAEGLSADYAYDALGRPVSVTDNRLAAGANATRYGYDANGNLASVTYPNEVETRYTYNALNRLTNVNAAKGGGALASYAYTLGAAGNRLSVAERGGRTVNYTYDALYRLTEERIGGDPQTNGVVAYTYDAAGNRLSRDSTAPGVGSVFSSYDLNDRLDSDTYDANGNTIAAGGRTYAYDSEDRLRSADGGAVSYAYDGDGNRVAQTTGGVTVHYLVDTNNHTGHAQIVEELVGGAVVRQYTYGHTLVSQRQLMGGTWQSSFYGFDGHGSVRYLTDAAGAVTDTYTYDAFGNLTARTGSTPNERLFAGEQFDANIGFYYLRARYMNPQTGRFQTADTFEGVLNDPLSLHKYLYANADPVNRIDPSGHFSFSIGGLAAAMAIGGVISAISGLNAQSTLSSIATDFIVGALEGAFFYFVSGLAILKLAKYIRHLRTARLARALQAAFSRIENAGPLLNGTSIPKFFTFSTRAGKVFVNPNATKHLGEMVAASGSAGETQIAQGLILQSLEASITKASALGYTYGVPIVVDGWELIFVLERSSGGGLVPLVLKHARYVLPFT